MAAPEREHVCECNVHYNAKKMEAEVWSSFSLACSSERYSLPPKLDMKTVIIDTSKENDMAKMIVKNCMHSEFSRSAGRYLITRDMEEMACCLEQSEAMKTDKALDADLLEGGYVLKPRPGYMMVIGGKYLSGSIMVELNILVERTHLHRLWLQRCCTCVVKTIVCVRVRGDVINPSLQQ